MEFYVHPFIVRPHRTVSVILADRHNFGMGFAEPLCLCIEDGIREIPGVLVESWKVPGKTAIPAGRYKFGLAHSPKFGPDTPTIYDVPGFVGIRAHANANSDAVSEDSSEGCLIVGAYLRTGDGKLGGDEFALMELKRRLSTARARGEACHITIYRPGILESPV